MGKGQLSNGTIRGFGGKTKTFCEKILTVLQKHIHTFRFEVRFRLRIKVRVRVRLRFLVRVRLRVRERFRVRFWVKVGFRVKFSLSLIHI